MTIGADNITFFYFCLDPFHGTPLRGRNRQIKMLLPIVERIEGKLDFMRMEQASEKVRTEAVKEELKTLHSEGGVSKGFIAGVLAVGILVGTSVVSVAKTLWFLRLFGG